MPGPAGETGPSGPAGPTGPAGTPASLLVIEKLTQELADVHRELAVQYKRIAQLQAELNNLRAVVATWPRTS
jgi:hypothetical protein